MTALAPIWLGTFGATELPVRRADPVLISMAAVRSAPPGAVGLVLFVDYDLLPPSAQVTLVGKFTTFTTCAQVAAVTKDNPESLPVPYVPEVDIRCELDGRPSDKEYLEESLVACRALLVGLQASALTLAPVQLRRLREQRSMLAGAVGELRFAAVQEQLITGIQALDQVLRHLGQQGAQA